MYWFFVLRTYTFTRNGFSYQADVISVDNFYDEEAKDYKGEQYSKTTFGYRTLAKNGDKLDIQQSFRVESPGGKVIYENKPVYTVDRETTAIISGQGGEGKNSFLFAPPRAKKNGIFSTWLPSSQERIWMHYAGEERLYGLKVYKFESADGDEVDQTAFRSDLPKVPTERGIKLRAKNEMWVEPTTGYLVKWRDYSQDYYFYDIKTGQRIAPYNQFENSFSTQSVIEKVSAAKRFKRRYYAVHYVAPILLLVIVLYVVCRSVGLLPPLGRRWYWPLLASLLIGAGVVSFVLVNNAAIKTGKSKLESDEAQLKRSINERFSIYINTLYGGKALFEGVGSVTKDQWSAYYNSLEVATKYPGIQGLSFASRVSDTDKLAYQDAMRKSGLSDFTIVPAGTRSYYTPVQFIEPLNTSNAKAVGFDLSSEANRKSSINYATEKGSAAITPKIVLVQDSNTKLPGFLVVVPVYRQGLSASEEKNPDDVIGYVTAPFRAADFISNVYDAANSKINFEIYDGLKTVPDSLLYSSTGGKSLSDKVLHYDAEQIYVGNRVWTIAYANKSDFRYNNMSAWLVFGSVLTIGMLMFGQIYAIQTSRNRAVRYGNELTKELRASASALKKYEAIVRDSNVAIISRDLNNTITAWNTGATKLYGYSAKEMIGKNARIVLPPGNNDPALHAPKIRAGKRILNYVTKRVRKDGAVIDVSLTVSPIKDDHGRVVGSSVVARDVTKELKTERAMSEFVSLASHQLQTPATAVKQFLNLVLDGYVSPLLPDQKDLIAKANYYNDEQISIVRDLLAVARVEDDSAPVHTDKLKLRSLINEVVAAQKETIAARKQKLHLSVRDVAFEADETKLKMTVGNLLSNAAKFTPEGGHIWIDAGKTKDGKQIEIVVRDSGKGIAPEDQNRLFNKFSRIEKDNEDVPGTGLGLYLCQKNIERMKGKITFDASYTEGAKFIITLPIRSDT